MQASLSVDLIKFLPSTWISSKCSISENPEFWILGLSDFPKVRKIRKFGMLENHDVRFVSGNSKIRFPKIRIFGNPGIRTFRFPHLRISGNPDFWQSENSDVQNSGASDAEFSEASDVGYRRCPGPSKKHGDQLKEHRH